MSCCPKCGWDGQALAEIIYTAQRRLDLLLWEMEIKDS